MKRINQETMDSILRDMIDRQFDMEAAYELTSAITSYRTRCEKFETSNNAYNKKRMMAEEMRLKEILSKHNLEYSVDQFLR